LVIFADSCKRNKPKELLMFPCIKCGACCRRVDHGKEVLKLFPELGEFPYSHDESGKCEKLIDDMCSVYETRPTICRMDKVAEILELDKNPYYQKNIEACNRMLAEEGSKKRIIL